MSTQLLETFKNSCSRTRRAYLICKTLTSQRFMEYVFHAQNFITIKKHFYQFFSHGNLGRFQSRKRMWLEKTSSCFCSPCAWRGEVPAWPGCVCALALSAPSAGGSRFGFHPESSWFYNNYQCKKPEPHKIMKKHKTTIKPRQRPYCILFLSLQKLSDLQALIISPPLNFYVLNLGLV